MNGWSCANHIAIGLLELLSNVEVDEKDVAWVQLLKPVVKIGLKFLATRWNFVVWLIRWHEG